MEVGSVLLRYVHRFGKPGFHHSCTQVAAAIAHTRTYTSRSREGRAGKLVRELGGVTAGRGPSFCTSGGPVRAPHHTQQQLFTHRGGGRCTFPPGTVGKPHLGTNGCRFDEAATAHAAACWLAIMAPYGS